MVFNFRNPRRDRRRLLPPLRNGYRTLMIDEREIWACANEILRQYGDAATFHAAQRADELLETGDVEGQRTWLRILARINDLETAALPSERLN